MDNLELLSFGIAAVLGAWSIWSARRGQRALAGVLIVVAILLLVSVFVPGLLHRS